MDMQETFVILVKPTFTINVGQTPKMGAPFVWALCEFWVHHGITLWLAWSDFCFICIVSLLFLAMVIAKNH